MKGNLDKLDDQELLQRVEELKEEARALRFELKIKGTIPNVKRFREIRKEIARVKTILNQRRKKQ